MEIIQKLKYHDNDQLEEWLEFDGKTTKKFLKNVVKFTNKNQTLLKEYCVNTLPSEFSSLSIVYEALSEYSTDFNDFLFEEIKRVIILAKEKKIKPKYLDVLTDIEVEDIYSKDEENYIKILNFMITNLHLNNDKNFNIQLLKIVDWFLIELDEEEDEILEVNNWLKQINILASEGDLSVRIKAQKVLKNVNFSGPLNSLSFLERLLGFLKL